MPTDPFRLHRCDPLAYGLLVEALDLLWHSHVPDDPPVPQAEAQSHPWRRNWPWTKPEMVAAVQAFVAKHGRQPTWQEFHQAMRHDLPGHMTVRRMWGTRAALLSAAGVRPPPRKGGNQYTKQRKEQLYESALTSRAASSDPTC